MQDPISFADVIFSYLWSRILHKLQHTLEDSIPEDTGLRLASGQQPPATTTRGFLGPTWMDDTCVCVSDPSPQALERKIHQATCQLLELCDVHGLTPNLGAGKTEVLLTFQGHGLRKMTVKYFGPSSDRSLLIVGERGPRRVRVVAHYTHLGCVTHHRGDSRAEARRRIAIAFTAQEAFTPKSSLVYAKEAGTFSNFGDEPLLLWHGIMDPGRGTHQGVHPQRSHAPHSRLLGRAHDEHLTDEDILTMVGINSPTSCCGCPSFDTWAPFTNAPHLCHGAF